MYLPFKPLFDFLIELVKVDQVVGEAYVEVVLNGHVFQEIRSIVSNCNAAKEAISEVVSVISFHFLLPQSPFLCSKRKESLKFPSVNCRLISTRPKLTSL